MTNGTQFKLAAFFMTVFQWAVVSAITLLLALLPEISQALRVRRLINVGAERMRQQGVRDVSVFSTSIHAEGWEVRWHAKPNSQMFFNVPSDGSEVIYHRNGKPDR